MKTDIVTNYLEEPNLRPHSHEAILSHDYFVQNESTTLL